MNLSIKGIQEAQQANLTLIRAVNPRNGLGRAVQKAAFSLHRYAVATTHVQTGALKASHRIEVKGPARYVIFIDPSSKNPKTQEPPAEYGIYEHSKGGSHAFYEITLRNYGDRSAQQGLRVLVQEFKK